MSLHYYSAADIKERSRKIVRKLKMTYIDTNKMLFLRSSGSKSKKAFARSHKVSKDMQIKLDTKARYAIEIISENFDTLNEAQKTKVIIHELLHIPQRFQGKFKSHDYNRKKRVEELYKQTRHTSITPKRSSKQRKS